MSGNGMKIFFAIAVSLLAPFKVSSIPGAPSASVKCIWDQYYDDIMKDCGPCSEICTGVVNKNVKIGTENQCRSECSDYLTSLTCTKNEYFDDIMHSCAPCSEICNFHEYTRTTEECSSKCKAYVPEMEKLCKAIKQYFDEESIKCRECSDLCRFNEPNATDPACFVKCHAYVEAVKYRPNQKSEGYSEGSTDSTEQSSPSGVHPGVITSIAICVVGVVAALAFSLYWFHFRPNRYAPAPVNDAEEALRTGDAQPVDTRNGGQDLSFGMKELGPSIQVSSEGVAQQTTTDEAGGNDVNQDIPGPDQEFARPEMDPLGPSSAASGHVLYRDK